MGSEITTAERQPVPGVATPAETTTGEKRESNRKPVRFGRLNAGLLGASVGLAAGLVVQEARVERGSKRTEVALALGRAGFNNVMRLKTANNGLLQATLALDKDNPQGCSITLNVMGNANETLRLVLPQTDAAGVEYNQKDVTTPDAARELLLDECS